MFNLSSSHLIQLLIGGGCGILLFIFATIGFGRFFYKILIIIIPFQFISSKYGSINMVLTYVLGASILFLSQPVVNKKAGGNWPLIFSFFFIILSFFVSLSQTPAVFLSKNLFYFISFFSNIILFYMSYKFISDENDIHTIFKCLFICNLLVILYCIIQLIVGFGEFQFLGIKEFSFIQNRADNRLLGPFNAPGITAEYLVIQCILLAYYSLTTNFYKKSVFILIFCNVAALVGTGNRGGFISFFLAFFLFIYLFRKEIGVLTSIKLGIIVFFILVSSSFLMIKYTDFNVIYQRILGTTMKGITPDTRSGWPYVVEKIKEKPLIGHCPNMVMKSEIDNITKWPKKEIDFYPHNLYLYILYTTGLFGLLAYITFMIRFLFIIKKENKRLLCYNNFLSNLPRLALIVFIIILFDQMKVEALRSGFSDYQHYLSCIFGMFAGLKNISNTETSSL